MATVTGATKKEHDKREMAKRSGKHEEKKEVRASNKKPVHMGNWMKKYKENEDKNYHSENVIRLANLAGHVPHHETALDIHNRHIDRGYLDEADSKARQSIHDELYPVAEKMNEDWESANSK